MRATLLFLAAAALAPAQILLISPPVITECTSGLGRATLSWHNPLNARVQIRVGAPDGTPMTDFAAPDGSAETGNWVTDGMVFFLVNQDGVVIDRAVASLNCGGTQDTTTAAFTASAVYFPLQPGNRWIYRADSRAETSGWVTWTLTKTVQISGQTWLILEVRAGDSTTAVETPYRSGPDGKVYRMPGYPKDLHEELWLDPSGGAQSPAVLHTQQRDVPVSTPFGQLPGLQYLAYGSLTVENGTMVRGLGLLTSTTGMTTGSSGGFYSSLVLVEAKIGQAVYYFTPAASVSITAESSRLNVSGKQVTNCAVPCYFTACQLAPGADPPGTWKPCFQARIRAGLPAGSAATPLEADLELTSASGSGLYRKTLGLTAAPPQNEASAYTQVPLYSAPNVALPPGAYRLSVTIRGGDVDSGSASIPVKVE